jgi:hypothetical protein
MSSESIEFIDCSSVNVNYDIMGVVTVSYTVVHNKPEFVTYDSIDVGGVSFDGYVTNASMNPMPKSEGWYETTVTLVSTTE